MRLPVSLSSVLLLALVFAPAAVAQPTDDELGDNSALASLIPEARTAPAPAFLQPGVRISYSSAGAVIGSDVPVSGGGVIQYDVTARDARQVLAFQQNWFNNGVGAAPLGAAYARGYPGIGPFWVAPGVLNNAEARANPNLAITRFAKTLDTGEQATVVRFEGTTANGRTVREFDQATGLMVFSSISAGASAAQLRFIGLRTLPTPWSTGRAPNWVRPGATLDFTRTITQTVFGAGGSTQDATTSVVIGQAGARWSLQTAATTQNGQPAGQGVLGTGAVQMVGAIWIPVTALATLIQAGPTQIDVDPITGAMIFLQRVSS